MSRPLFLAALLWVTFRSFAVIPPGGYSSFLGGRSSDYGTENAFGVDVDAAGSAYVGGVSDSEPFPAARRYGAANRGGFVVKISPDGSQQSYSTFFDGVAIIAVKLTAANELFALGQIGRDTQPYINLGAPGGGSTDAVLLKLDAQGALLWGRYLGGEDLEVPRSLAVDAQGNAYLAGFTTSTNFPATAGAAQRAPGGGFDGFVAKISPQGAVVYATYLGGESSENVLAIAVDAQQRAIIAGTAFSDSFASTPVTARFGPGGGSDAILCRLNAAGSAVDWATKLGGSLRDSAISIALDGDGSIVLLGTTESPDFPVANSLLRTNLLGPNDLFLARASADGQQLVASTYFGSADGEDLGDPFYVEFTLNGVLEQRSLFPENAGVAIGPNGDLHVAARINSANWPVPAEFPLGYGGGSDGCFARFSRSLGTLLDLRFLGGGSDDATRAIAVDAAGNSYLVGTVFAPAQPPFFITSANAFQPEYGGAAMDAMVVKIPAGPVPPASGLFEERIRLSGLRVSGRAWIDHPPSTPGDSQLVWFTWRAPAAGRVVASSAGSTLNLSLEAYSGLAWPSLTLLASGAGRINVPVTAGTDYHFAMAGLGAQSGIARLSLAFSQPPNDDFASAAPLAGFPVLADGSNINSTAEPGEPAHDESIPARSVWWKWLAPETRSVAVSTEGSSFDTVVAVYNGEAIGGLERIASNDDFSFETRTSEAVFLAEKDQTYFVAVDGPPDEYGPIKLRLLSNEPPANDAFASRSNLTGLAQQVIAANRRATLEPNEPRLAFTNALDEVDASFSGATVWWSWTAPREGRLRLDTLGSDFDTRLAVYTNSVLTNLTRVAANNDLNRQLGLRASLVEFDTVAGQPYFIQIDGSTSEQTGIIKLNLKLTFPPRILAPSLRQDASGQWSFQAEGVPGDTYRAQSSADLQTWENLPATFTEASGLWQFSFPAKTQARLFIRLSGLAPD